MEHMSDPIQEVVLVVEEDNTKFTKREAMVSLFSFLNPFKTNPPINAKARLLLPIKQILGCTALNI